MSDYDNIRNALTYIDPNDRETWLRIGAAVKDELGEDGFEMWDNWSRQASNYNESDAKSVWKSLKQGHIHIGTLFYHARANGYRPEKPYTPPSAEELAKRAQEAQEKQRAEAERIAQAHAKAEKTAYGIWKNTQPADPNHAYAQNKGLNEAAMSGIRQNEYNGKKQLIIPLYSDKKLVNVQTIDEDGNKSFLSGGQKQGAYTIIGDFKQNQNGIVLAEGFATAASVHQATGKPVVVAFDAGNLKAVSEKLLNVLPENVPVYFAADNDPSHTGEHKAQAAAEVWGERAKIMLPEFTPTQIQQYQQEKGVDKVPTDFNDLQKLAGIEAVREALSEIAKPEIKQPKPEIEPSAPMQEYDKPELSQAELMKNNYWRVQNGYDPLPEHTTEISKENPMENQELLPITHRSLEMIQSQIIEIKELNPTRYDVTYLENNSLGKDNAIISNETGNPAELAHKIQEDAINNLLYELSNDGQKNIKMEDLPPQEILQQHPAMLREWAHVLPEQLNPIPNYFDDLSTEPPQHNQPEPTAISEKDVAVSFSEKENIMENQKTYLPTEPPQRNQAEPTITSEKDASILFNGIEYDGLRHEQEQPENQPEPSTEPIATVKPTADKFTPQPDLDEPELPRPESLERQQPILDLAYERPPKNLQSRYVVAENGQYLSADNHTTVLFEDKGNALKTAKSDNQTIQDMLEVAKAKGWDSIKISGSPEFKAMMYVAAESQGIKTTGYKPTPADLTLLAKLREDRALNGIQSTHKPELDPKQPENHAPNKPDVDALSTADKLKNQSAMPDVSQINTSPIADTEQAPKVSSLGNKTIPSEVLRSTEEMTTAALSPQVEAAKSAYDQKAQHLSAPNKERLKAYERNTMDALRDVQGDARTHALRNYYEHTTNAMNGTELNLPQPMQNRAPTHNPAHETKQQSNSQDFEMER